MRRGAFILLALLAVSGISQALVGRGTAEAQKYEEPQQHSQVQLLLAAGQWNADAIPIDWMGLRKFYGLRADRLAWSGSDNGTKNSRIALDVLAGAEAEGLSPSDYHLEALRNAREAGLENEKFDILLTDAVLRYARDVSTGRVAPQATGSDVALAPARVDQVSALAAALSEGKLAEYLAALPPPQSAYDALRRTLRVYREVEASGGWPAVAASTKRDGSKASDANAPVLLTRLALEYPQFKTGTADTLKAELMHFQEAHGLDADGVAGPATTRELNVPATARIEQIEMNMERWRWLPRTLEPRRIAVNVPAAELEAYDGDQVVLRSRIIVGRKTNPTPILKTYARGVVVNPPWEIPATIARKEILPKLARNPRYLADHHMIVVKAPLQLRQLPGPDNALGALKLDMPNAFNVYLHDTPARTLFSQTARDLSHGCMRVQEIRPLAAFALAGDPTETAQKLETLIAGGTTQRLALAAPLPVYVLYWTAWVDPEGNAQFRRDLYGRDQHLLVAIRSLAATRFAALAPPCPPACS
jgi:murein L,D-transpeptidase YcbB/YkuD